MKTIITIEEHIPEHVMDLMFALDFKIWMLTKSDLTSPRLMIEIMKEKKKRILSIFDDIITIADAFFISVFTPNAPKGYDGNIYVPNALLFIAESLGIPIYTYEDLQQLACKELISRDKKGEKNETENDASANGTSNNTNNSKTPGCFHIDEVQSK